VRDEFLTVPAHNPSSLSKSSTRAHVVVHGCGPASTSAVRPASQQLVETQATYDQQRQRDQLRVGAEARAWIDILVNSVWGGCEGMIENGVFTWSKPFWEQPLWRWDAMFYAGVRAHYHASQLAAPMMIAQSATAGSRRNGGNCQKGPEKRNSANFWAKRP
jgi:NAD(P)-dependent dehydrogenase (short-subunit alcohol dehydrogenase family)